MYAKLVVGASNIYQHQAIRDIARLLTATSAAPPSLSMLGAFSQAASIIVDATPAGWEYVGSNVAADRPNIAAVGTANPGAFGTLSAAAAGNLVMRAPCLNSTKYKYAALTDYYYDNTSASLTGGRMGFALTGAINGTDQGVLTNESYRFYAAGSSGDSGVTRQASLRLDAGVIIHVMANPRHITIVQENRGVMGVWETSSTDLHDYYGITPMIAYFHGSTAQLITSNLVVPQYATNTFSGIGWMHTAFGLTKPADGTTYGTYNISVDGTRNIHNLAITTADRFQNTIDAAGNLRYLINPIFFQMDSLGYPTQFVSGISPIYLAKNGIGNSGDTVNVGSDTYKYLDCGNFGLLVRPY